MLKEIFSTFFPPHWQGVAFDLIFVLLGLFILPFIGGRLQSLFEESFKDNERSFVILLIFIIVVFFWRLFALIVKRIPLQKRLENEDGLESVGCLWILNLFGVLLSTAFVLVAVIELLKIYRLGDYSDFDTLIGVVGMAFPILELILLYRLTRPLSKEERREAQSTNPAVELFADLGLFAYMFVWQAFYNVYLTAIVPNAFRSVLVFVGIFVISLIVFVMFYLGPRSVFLIEDAGYKSTWLSISLVFLVSFASHLVFAFIGV